MFSLKWDTHTQREKGGRGSGCAHSGTISEGKMERLLKSQRSGRTLQNRVDHYMPELTEPMIAFERSTRDHDQVSQHSSVKGDGLGSLHLKLGSY